MEKLQVYGYLIVKDVDDTLNYNISYDSQGNIVK